MLLEGHESAHANVFQSGALEEPWQFSHKPAIHGAMVGERGYDPPCPVTIRMGQQDTLNRCLVSDTNYRPRLASKTKKAAGPTRQPSATSVTGVGTLLLRFQDVRCDEHGRGRPLILRPMHSFLSLRPRVTLRMLFHRTTLTVLSECALYDVRDGRPVLMRVDPDNTARLKVENPQPKLPSLHPFDLGGEVMSNCLLDR